jgi:hypothetical protein
MKRHYFGADFLAGFSTTSTTSTTFYDKTIKIDPNIGPVDRTLANMFRRS